MNRLITRSLKGSKVSNKIYLKNIVEIFKKLLLILYFILKHAINIWSYYYFICIADFLFSNFILILLFLKTYCIGAVGRWYGLSFCSLDGFFEFLFIFLLLLFLHVLESYREREGFDRCLMYSELLSDVVVCHH